MAKSSCPTRGASLLCIRKPSIVSAATAAVSSASARQNISTCTRSPRLLGQFSARYPAVKLQIELGIGPDISALLDEGELDLVIVSNEIREGDGIPLARERRVWAAGRAMKLDPKEPAPLALYPPCCRWRQLALEELDRAGRPWTLVLQSAGTAGIVAALETPGLPSRSFPSSTCRIA